jgi:N-acetylmuramic acid 6-phosphate etherase
MNDLLTEARNPQSEDLDVLTAVEIVRLMNAEDASVPAAVATQAESIARAIDVIVERFQRGGRIVYVGAGTSGRLGVLDASECPPTFNSPPGQVVGLIAGGLTALTTAVEGAEDHPESAEADLRQIQLSGNDVLVGIATSGRTPYVIGAMRFARSLGTFAIGLACVNDPALAADADLMIAPLVGPEVLTGSTRLKAGTATKLVLNMLTTGAMVRLGKAYGNLMVDLRATNFKLKGRTNRIVRHLLGITSDQADELLARCSGELKTAIIVGRTGVTPDEARKLLAEAGGRIAAVLGRRESGVSYPQHVLGVDGGGTQVEAILAIVEDGKPRVVGRGQGGPANVNAESRTGAFAQIRRAIDAAFDAARLPRGRVGAVCFGLAGAGRAAEQRAVSEWAELNQTSTLIEVTGDVALPIALLPQQTGVVIVAGTGSCVLGRTGDGRNARAGGWGPMLGDEGSAYGLTMSALRAIMRTLDARGRSTSLTERLLQQMELTEPAQVISAIHGDHWNRTRLATLAPEVIRAADEGDGVANGIVSEHVGELAENAAVVVRRLSLPREGIAIALAGGLLTRSPTYRDRLLVKLGSLGIRPGHVVEASEPAIGAVLRAVSMLTNSRRD